jgi:hypothetical protein
MYISVPSASVAICGFEGPMFFVIYGFAICGPKFFCGLKTSANPQILNFSPYKYIPKRSNANFYQIKNYAKQICSRLLDSFARRESFLKNVSFSLSYGGKFADLQFADWLT